jgi:acetylornithine deacetylase
MKVLTSPATSVAVDLLSDLIRIPSFSREESDTAACLEGFFEAQGVETFRLENNVWAFNNHYDEAKPSILLNSHHDAVRPVSGWTRNPFEATIENEKLYGLGSNDAGGALVALIATFLHFYECTDLPYNLVFAATAEEEISGKNGMELLYPQLGPIAFAIVGEPTLMQMAVAEKGLLVIDGIATGRAGHAAREEGENAITKALSDLTWISSYRFDKISEWLGPVKMSVTQINAGTQHNVIPAECRFTVDIRLTDQYTHEEVLSILRQHLHSTLTPRSTRLRPSFIANDHVLVNAAKKIGLRCYGSPTCSDQAFIAAPSVKIGPGDSARSHTADEFIFLHEIENGIATYIDLLETVFTFSA